MPLPMSTPAQQEATNISNANLLKNPSKVILLRVIKITFFYCTVFLSIMSYLILTFTHTNAFLTILGPFLATFLLESAFVPVIVP